MVHEFFSVNLFPQLEVFGEETKIGNGIVRPIGREF